MKILHMVTNGVYTEGTAYQEVVLPRQHAKMGHSVTILASCEIYKEGRLIRVDTGCKRLATGELLIRVPFVRVVNFYVTEKLRIVKDLYNILRRCDPDLIMLHGVNTLSVYTLRKYMRDNSRVRLIVDNHADFSNSATNFISRELIHKGMWRHIARVIEPYAEVFYGVLPARVDFLKDIYKIPEKKCQLLLLGAEDEKVERARQAQRKNKTRIKYGVDKKAFLIVTGGKIDNAKKQTLLLMRAVKEFVDVQLLIFGSIEDCLKEEFYTLLEAPNIRYIGWLNDEESYYVIASADLVVYPGRHSTLWEQTAGIGIPMVCKYWQGTDHVNEDGNVIFLYNDSIDEISVVLNEILYNDTFFKKMKLSAHKAMKRFSYQKIAEQCLQEHAV